MGFGSTKGAEFVWTMVILSWMMATRAQNLVDCLQGKKTELESELKSCRAREKWLLAVVIALFFFLFHISYIHV